MVEFFEKMKETIKSLGWEVLRNKDIFTFTHRFLKKYDIVLSIPITDISGVIHYLRTFHQNFDCSKETYNRLNDKGHGKGYYPHDMKDVYAGIERCKTHIEELIDSLVKLDKFSRFRLIKTWSENETEGMEYLKENGYKDIVKIAKNTYVCSEMGNQLRDVEELELYVEQKTNGQLRIFINNPEIELKVTVCDHYLADVENEDGLHATAMCDKLAEIEWSLVQLY